MKNIYILILFWFFLNQSFCFSQVKVDKISSFDLPRKAFKDNIVFTPKFPLKDKTISDLMEGIQKVSSINEPVNIGKNLVFMLDFDSLERISRNEKVYQEIVISSPDSKTLSVNFSHIELGKSSKLFIINDKESYLLGPITSKDVKRSVNFDPGFIPGDEIRILLEEDIDESSRSKISISRVGHIVYDFYGSNTSVESNSSGCYGFNCSASCLHNIICYPNLSLESKAVALITYSDPLDPFGNIGFHGSGFLINNGAQNKRALFLAMIHGIGGYMVPDLKFIFHYKSPQCNPTTSGSSAYFVQGATQLGLDPANDRRLLELTTNPGTSSVFTGNPVSYLGWSIVDEQISTVYGIGHPKADVQKYMEGGSAIQFTEPDQSIGVWKFNMTAGFPETNSSGGPVFDSEQRVIGSLLGIASEPELTCSNFSNTDIFAVRLSRSWDLLCQYLDPNNEGIVKLNTITNTSSSKIIPSVSAPDVVCSSANIALTSAPLDLQISWNIVQGSNLLSSPSSGNGKSFLLTPLNSNVSGPVKVRFTVEYSCNSKYFEKIVQIGKPEIPTITILGVSPSGAVSARVEGDHSPPFKWYVNGNHVLTTYSSNTEMNIPGGSCGSTRLLGVSTENTCGESISESRPEHFFTVPCFSYNLFPNPLSDELTIEQHVENKTDLGINANFEIKIFDGAGNELHSQKSFEKSITINVSKLNPGSYYVHIVNNGEIIKKQIRIER